MPISSKLPLKINTVHNLITFSIVFTNKKGGGVDSTPSPPIKTRSFKHPIKPKVNTIFSKRINLHAIIIARVLNSGILLGFESSPGFDSKVSYFLHLFYHKHIQITVTSYGMDPGFFAGSYPGPVSLRDGICNFICRTFEYAYKKKLFNITSSE